MEPLKSNILEVVQNFIQEGGKHILTQGTDIVDFEDNFELSKFANNIYSNTVQVAIGIHPSYFEEITLAIDEKENIFEKSQRQIEKYVEIFEKRKKDVSAIGECGLDYFQFSLNNSYSKDEKEQLKEIQKIMFRKEIGLAVENSLPISVHSRNMIGSDECISDTIRIIAEEGKGLLEGSFHSFTGNIEQLNQILELGFHIGFNGIITYKSGESVREILKKTPFERILFETDGPFLPPQSVRKNNKVKEKFAQPKDIREIMQVVCDVKSVEMQKLEDITDESYENLFI